MLGAVVLAACGGRGSINGDAPVGSGGTSGQVAPSSGGAPVSVPPHHGGQSARDGGSPGIISAGGAISSHGGGSGVAGTGGVSGTGTAGSPTKDEPGTIGNEAVGRVECWGPPDGVKQSLTVCDAPQQCCAATHQCLSIADTCAFGRQSCDGDEDCAAGSHCCRDATATFSCQAACTSGSIRHLPCNGECSDFDNDGVPDRVDLCPTSEREDGRGPLTDDGCRDTDADGVRDDLDGCPGKLEDGKGPKPNDGCPA